MSSPKGPNNHWVLRSHFGPESIYCFLLLRPFGYLVATYPVGNVCPADGGLPGFFGT